MKHIRLATSEEVESIRANSDLDGQYQVLATEVKNGPPILACIKHVVELDPLHSGGATDTEKARFIWGCEERMLGAGIQRYYFNILESDSHWQEVVTKWGAIRTSTGPESRFLRKL